MFWVLAGMALAVFAPCVLVPVWIETEQILEHERLTAAKVAQLEAQVEHNEARKEALLGDPLVNERILRRELNYRAEEEELIRWSPVELAAMSVPSPAPTVIPEPVVPEVPDPRPAWMTSVMRWLPPWPWRELFGKPANRMLLMLMALGLLSAAFILYSPRGRLTLKIRTGR
jgi:hypothetical protein